MVTFGADFELAKANVTSSYFVSSGAYNQLISNRDFVDINSMSESAIQSFLATYNSPLKDYSEGGLSAAKIIYDSAHGIKHTTAGSYGDYSTPLGETFKGVLLNSSTGTVSPRVILATLQKEQSLITGPPDLDYALTRAMGYQCPDSSGCSPKYWGFTMQVEWGAWQLRYNYERSQGNGLDFQVGQTMPNVDGKYDVTFLNAATASLYRYTPHVFNGNFNFYNLFNGWFTASADSETNDSANFTLKTYDATQTIAGEKETNAFVYLNGTQIRGSGTRSWSITLSDLANGTNHYTIEYKDGGGTLLAQKSITIEVHKAGDINGDNNIDLQDLSIFATYWDQINPDEPLANLTGEVGHRIDVADLSILAGYWGK